MAGRVSVVLVTWNSAPFLRRCLAGIAGQTWRDLGLIAVDNASSDESVAIIRELFPHSTVIVNDTNRGFTGAVNQGIEQSTGEFVLLCNPDAFLEPEYIERIVQAFEGKKDFGAATGKLLRATGTNIEPTNIIDSKGIRMTRSGRHFDIDQGLVDRVIPSVARDLGAGRYETRDASHPFPQVPRYARDDTPVEVFGVSGAAAIYRMSFLQDAKIDDQVFDEDFFTYREDADLAWRGQLLGWRALYVPDAIGYHVRTVTPEKRRSLAPVVNMHSVKNRFLLRLKNEGPYLALRNALFEIPRDVVAIAAVLTIERTSLPALTWLWKNRRRIMARRREIQQRRRVSDRQLASWFR